MSASLETDRKPSGASENQKKRNNPKKSIQPNTVRVTVAGNPNSGKSTLINAMAGTRLHVGNWPGVTVEKKEATLDHKGMQIQLVDLPGTYSLSPYTQEEIIARDYLIHEKPDVIIDVVDATNLERNLYLTVQLMELEIPMVMALNIFDEAEAKGFGIDTKAMEEVLGMGVVPTVATKGSGLDLLLEKVIEAAGSQGHKPKQLSYGADIDEVVSQLWSKIENVDPSLARKYPPRWLSLKLLEGDEYIYRELNLPEGEFPGQEMISHLKKAHDSDIEVVMADARYGLASGLTREVLKLPELGKADLTEKIDRVVLNRFLGIPVFLASMWLVFKLTFDVSTPFVDWVDEMTAGPFKRWTEAFLGAISAPDWTISLVNDGGIAGAGFVLVFVPVIFAMMFFITFLEGSGYMARAAFVMDRAMHSMGLHGKSFIPHAPGLWLQCAGNIRNENP